MTRLGPRLRQSVREVAAIWWYLLTAPSRRAARSTAAHRADLLAALESAAAEAAGKEAGPEQREMACAVLSLANEPGLVDAVRSLLRQHPRPEIVVVNSGGGDPASTLHAAGIAVPVIDVPEHLLAGAVRNLGIEATSARYVSFLAADCIAEPGWVAGRLRAHQGGAAAVTSALTVAPPQTLSAYASHLLLHHRRRAEAPPDDRVLAGLSYERDVLSAHGRFREDMAVGEDTEYVERLDPHEMVAWSANVRTSHRYPSRVTTLVRDQFVRGRRAAQNARRFGGPRSAPRIAARNLRNILFAIERARTAADPDERRLMLAATPLLVLGALACATGVLTALWTPRNPGGTR
jgi:glycosyltransferase involved in cell wall biosynthesis